MPTDSNDIFEQRLDDAIEKLRACQEQKALSSCNDCPECIGCEIRRAYVQAAYDSMSKGETGGFEF
jgi:hypothetical protein